MFRKLNIIQFPSKKFYQSHFKTENKINYHQTLNVETLKVDNESTVESSENRNVEFILPKVTGEDSDRVNVPKWIEIKAIEQLKKER